MIRWIVLAIVLSLPTSASAQQAGVALRWDACYGDGNAVTIKSFACDTNAGAERLVGSFATLEDQPEVVGIEIVVDFWTHFPAAQGSSEGPELPAWWQFKNDVSCRHSALQLELDPIPDNPTCQEWIFAPKAGGIAGYNYGVAGPGTARIHMGVVGALGATGAVFAGTTYTAFTISIEHTNTVGSGACAGCSVPVGIVLNRLIVAGPTFPGQPSNHIGLSGPLNGTDSDLTFWQARPGTVPTRTSTWGAVKALYR